MSEWGKRGSAHAHARYITPAPKPHRRKCPHGTAAARCTNKRTHFGAANGVVLTGGCEFHMRMWVRDPNALFRRRR